MLYTLQTYGIIPHMAGTLTVKKSPIVIVRNFVALQFASAGLYMLAGSLAYYARLWRSLPLVGGVQFELAQGVFMFGIEIWLIAYMFLSWYRQGIQLSHNQLTYDEGIFIRSHTIIPFSRVARVSVRQSFLGRLLKYGSVDVRDAQGVLLIRLSGMQDPHEFADAMLKRCLPLSGASESDPAALVSSEEHEHLERKSTFRWDVHTKSVNKALEKAAVKTIAAFMNSQGGHLILGIGDDGGVVGVERDYGTLMRRDADGLQNHVSNVLSAMIGPTFRQHVRMRPFKHEGKECMLVSVDPSDRPAYVRDQDHEEFFIRTGNGTTSLRMSDANAYIPGRFRNI